MPHINDVKKAITAIIIFINISNTQILYTPSVKLRLNAIHVRALTNYSHSKTNKCTSVKILLFTDNLSHFRHVSICLDH